jgi:DNA polymerase III epsilon subunit-like protein
VFSDDFKNDKDKQTQWHAFNNKNALKSEIKFSEVVEALQYFLEPVYDAIAEKRLFQLRWISSEFLWKGGK